MEDWFSTTGILVGWVFLAFLFWAADWHPFSSYVVVYPVFCSSDGGHTITPRSSEGTCSGRVYTGNRVEYRAFPARQIVVAKFLDGIGSVMRYDNCTVFDRDNWYCGSGSISLSMVDGDLTELPNETTQYVSKWRWWLKKIAQLGD